MMTLEDCPFCQIVARSTEGNEHCVKGTYTVKHLLGQAPEVVEVVILKQHTDRPSVEALAEAVRMVEGSVGSEVRDVAGHWGMKISRPDWVQKPKANTKTGPKGEVYNSLK